MKKIAVLIGVIVLISIAAAVVLIDEKKSLIVEDNPLYLTIIIHNEEDTGSCTNPKPQIPDYDGDEEILLQATMAMREFGEMVASHGAKINFGSDWTFSDGVELYDPTFYSDMEAMGHEIDAHAHASCVLYHEVREEIVEAGGNPTNVASGMTEEQVYNTMSYFDRYYPEFEILWGVADAGHNAGEETSGWVWRPSQENWLEHDSDGDYIHIGHGEYVNSVEFIESAIEERYDDRINTYAVFTNPREFLAAAGTEGIPEEWTAKPESYDYWEKRIEWWDEFLTELNQLEDLEYASLTEIAEIFVENEDNLNFDFDTEKHPRSDDNAVQRQTEAGYP